MSEHLHADYEWKRQIEADRARREAGGTHFPECGQARKPLPKRSRWQRVKDEIARWRRK